MNISIRCPKCSQISQAPDTMGGSVIACPACGASLRVPAVAGVATQAGQPAVAVNPFETPPGTPAPDDLEQLCDSLLASGVDMDAIVIDRIPWDEEEGDWTGGVQLQ